MLVAGFLVAWLGVERRRGYFPAMLLLVPLGGAALQALVLALRLPFREEELQPERLWWCQPLWVWGVHVAIMGATFLVALAIKRVIDRGRRD